MDHVVVLFTSGRSPKKASLVLPSLYLSYVKSRHVVRMTTFERSVVAAPPQNAHLIEPLLSGGLEFTFKIISMLR